MILGAGHYSLMVNVNLVRLGHAQASPRVSGSDQLHGREALIKLTREFPFLDEWKDQWRRRRDEAYRFGAAVQPFEHQLLIVSVEGVRILEHECALTAGR